MDSEVIESTMAESLDAMTLAPKYHQWILDEFKPFIGKKIIEVGAGAGYFSKYLLSTNPEVLYSIEPSPNLYPHLYKMQEAYRNDVANKTQVFAYNNLLQDNAGFLKGKVDSVVYINVLEHIEKDLEELKLVHSILGLNGHVMIFVPALQWIYGTHDYAAGHFRRYYKKELKQKVEAAGFQIEKIIYFDMMGILPWWICFRLLKLKHLSNAQAGTYDKLIVPLTRAIEKIFPVVAGKNLLLVAKKTN